MERRISLRDYTDRRFEDLNRYHDSTVKSVQDELDRRLQVMTDSVNTQFSTLSSQTESDSRELDLRLDRMSVFWDAMKDQAAAKVDMKLFEALNDRVSNLEKAFERQRGRMTVYAGLSGVLAVGLTILTLAVNHIRL
jgi:hypothetical protein